MMHSYLLECKEEATCDNDKAECQRQDTILSGQNNPSIAIKTIFPWKYFPFSPRPLHIFGTGLR